MDCDLSAPEPDETMENTDRGSGAPDTVGELALEIFALSDGAVRYEASGDAVNGRDVRGITQGFLHRTDRVELVPVTELTDDPVLGAGDAIDIPYAEADDRTAVAPWVTEAVRDAGGQVLSTGDFNVFPRPDDPFPAFKTDPNRSPSDQLAAMYERGFANLHDVIVEEAPENTYSFIFRGVSQILDHIFVDDATLRNLVVARYIHVNTDYPANTPGFEPGRGASDHDPLYARFDFALSPPCDRLAPRAKPPACR